LRSISSSLAEHDLIGKPASNFPDQALATRKMFPGSVVFSEKAAAPISAKTSLLQQKV
jgi:hypothetical protein